MKTLLLTFGLLFTGLLQAQTYIYNTGDIFIRTGSNYVMNARTGTLYYQYNPNTYIGTNGVVWQRSASGWISSTGHYLPDAYPRWQVNRYPVGAPQYRQPLPYQGHGYPNYNLRGPNHGPYYGPAVPGQHGRHPYYNNTRGFYPGHR